ncbi:hypothetical protein K439DRAFT_1659696 [Ramaria rubella]|nr:hypothetical protein K439DRAFT_1659696 [Ramaria rubella]
MAPAPKQTKPPMKQARLSFKTTKRGIPASSKIKAKAKARLKSKPKSQFTSDAASESDEDNEPVVVVEESPEANEAFLKKETLDMRDRSGQYKKYYKEAKKKMGWLSPIHAEGQTKIHHMLRVFDNTYDYGPCVGMTRMERWERAEALGLNPPTEVREILLTEQGSENEELIHPVFYGQVL